MSFVIAAPELMTSAATDLATIGSALNAANAAAAAPTTGILLAAEDEVSAQVAALFGAFGQQYQVISGQAQAFHGQFVNLMSAGAGAYLSTELANIQQNLLNAVNGPVQGLLGQSAGASDAVGAAASGLTAARTAPLPLLGDAKSVGSILGGGGLGSILGTGAPLGRSINGALTALQNGSAVSLLSGQIGAVSQSPSGGIAGLPTAMRALAPGLLAPAASTAQADIAGPYETLFTNTAANLQTLESAIAANPAPFLRQFLINQIHYAQEILAGAEYILVNLPAVLASLPANIQAAIQALLAFDPRPFIQQFITNQLTYAQIIATSLQNAAHDFVVGLQALPAAFQSAVQALLAGDVGGAVSDIAQGFLGLFITGVDVTTTGNPIVPPGLTATVTLTGTLGDLLPILTIPGMMAQNFTNLLPPGSIPAQISQNFTNVINTLTDTSLTAQVLLTTVIRPPSVDLSLTATTGLPVALTIDALGAPVNALGAFGSSITTFVDEVQTGNPIGAIGTLIDAPAVITNAFLNGQSTLPLTFDIDGMLATLNLPLDGILVPQTPYTASVDVGPPFGTITVPVGGTPISGLATGLLVFAPEQLASAITP
jgi:hypothetical protein